MDSIRNSEVTRKLVALIFVIFFTFIFINDLLIFIGTSKEQTKNFVINIINGTFDEELNIRDPKSYINNKTKKFLVSLVKNATNCNDFKNTV
jgi:hypothetical protein